jgi:hypothetical protein
MWSAGRAAGADASVARNGCGGGPRGRPRSGIQSWSHRLAPPRCLVARSPEGRCPSASPLGNRAGSPDPSAVPPWSPASGGEDVVGGSRGWGGCLRCEKWLWGRPPVAARGSAWAHHSVGSRFSACTVRADPSGRCPSRSPLGNPDGSPDPSPALSRVGFLAGGGPCGKDY